MAQVFFGADTTPALGDLDSNFVDTYGLLNRFKTPVYTGSSWFASITGTAIGFGKDPTQTVDIALGRGYIATEEAPYGIAWRRQANNNYGALDLYGATGNTGTWIVGRLPGNNGGYGVATGDLASQTLRTVVDVNGNFLVNRSAQLSGGKLEVAGNLVLQPAGAAPTLGSNGDMSFQLVSSTQLKLLVRGSDGVTRSVTLTLA